MTGNLGVALQSLAGRAVVFATVVLFAAVAAPLAGAQSPGGTDVADPDDLIRELSFPGPEALDLGRGLGPAGLGDDSLEGIGAGDSNLEPKNPDGSGVSIMCAQKSRLAREAGVDTSSPNSCILPDPPAPPTVPPPPPLLPEPEENPPVPPTDPDVPPLEEAPAAPAEPLAGDEGGPDEVEAAGEASVAADAVAARETAVPPPDFVPGDGQAGWAPAVQAPSSGSPPLSVPVALAIMATAGALWRTVAFLAPLFSRLRDRQATDHRVRATILALVQQEPGIHLAEVRRRVGLAAGQARHHLGVLERGGLVVRSRLDRLVCYYPNQEAARRLGPIAPALKSERARQLLGHVLREPGCTVRAAEKATGLPPGSLGYHAERLAKARLVSVDRRGGQRRLFVADGVRLSAWVRPRP